PRGQQRDGHAVVHGAEQPAQGVQRPAAGLAAVAAAVDEEAEEDGERDQREADQVELALLELGQAGPRGRARRGAPGLRFATAGGGCAAWHEAALPSTPGPRALPRDCG